MIFTTSRLTDNGFVIYAAIIIGYKRAEGFIFLANKILFVLVFMFTIGQI